ncbi:MAG: S-layer protein [Candidatus Micrarchaeia archaeon]
MNSINAKKIAAITAGAALLGLGLAFASPVTFQNVPIISNAGAPQVQIVVGSAAKPSDGVAAANIAAAIGNLAFTSVPVTASVNATQAASVLHVVSVSNSSSHALVNPQVWLNESGTAISSGTYGFSALIGSVLNGAVPQNPGAATSTKSLQGSSSPYVYPEQYSIVASSPYTAESPYVNIGVPLATSVTATQNGGGVAFSSFSSGTNPAYDNILKVAPAGLLSSSGPTSETESLWVTGFPVYDQNAKSLALVDANLAYQVIFGSPINVKTSNAPTNQAFSLLGANYTTYNFSPPSITVNSGNFVTGGKISLAQAMTPSTIVNVSHSISAGNFTVKLQDLSYPSGTPAAIGVYYNGVLTNETSIGRFNTTEFNVSGHTLYVKVGQTFAGLYSYQRWARIQLFSNIVNLSSGSAFNSANPNYDVQLQWTTNATSSGSANELQGITIYGTSANSQTLLPDHSMELMTSPAVWKLTFLGQTLSPGSTDFDALQLATSTQSSVTYQNLAGSSSSYGVNDTAITEPANLFTVTSQIPNAFTVAGAGTSTLTYNLNPYELTETANYISSSLSGANAIVVEVVSAAPANSFVSSTYPLTVAVTGYTTQNSLTTQTATFDTASPAGDYYYYLPVSAPFNNVTNINMYLSSHAAVPNPGFTANVMDVINVNGLSAGEYTSSNAPTSGNYLTLATLSPYSSPEIMYTQAGKNYDLLTSGSSVTYQQPGQLQQTFTLAPTSVSTPGVRNEYFTYSIPEYPVPGVNSAPDTLTVGITNSTGGISATPLYYLNATAPSGTPSSLSNNVTYTPSGYTYNSPFNVPQGFITERGSEVASIGTTAVTLNLAKSVDMLQFAAGPSTTTITKSYKIYPTSGPGYTIGEATNLPNVSIANITASGIQASHYSISGISNITATPSVSTSDQPVLLSSLPTSPLVVLDSQANPASNLILVGSGYVNTLSAQLQKAYNISMTPTTQIDQAYGTNRILIAGYYANQTTAAANAFIQQLYAKAASS